MSVRELPSSESIAAICQRYHIQELSLFGSVARGEARADSDVDLLVKYDSDHHPSFRDQLAMEAEFKSLFGRPVDLVQPKLIVNPHRVRSIRKDRRLLYAA